MLQTIIAIEFDQNWLFPNEFTNNNWLVDWIRSSGAQQQTQQHHAFLFKKHLFLDQYINLSDPVEKELIYFQMLHSIRVDRFPITEMEAVRYLPLFYQWSC